MKKTTAPAVAIGVYLFAVSLACASEDALSTADRLLRCGKYGDAIQAYKAAAAEQPKSGRAQAGLTLALLKTDDIAGAFSVAKSAATALPDEAVTHAALGDVYFRKGELADADQEYHEALKLDQKSARGWLGLARIADLVSKHKTAKQYYEQAYALDPADPDVLRHWAGTLKSPVEEVAALEKYLTLVPYEDPERLDRVRRHIEIHKRLGDRKLFVLTSAYTKSELPLDLLIYDPHRPARGLGLRVSFNGGKRQELLLDTGASGIVLNHKAAEKYGIQRLTEIKLEGIGDKGPLSGYTGLAETVQVGNVVFRNCIVYVSDKNPVSDADGIIGTDVFDKFLVAIDFKARLIRLDPLPKRQDGGDEDDPYDRVISPEMKDFTPVFRYGHELLVSTRVGQHPPVLFIVDTGSSVNLVSTELARSVTNVSRENYRSLKGISGNVKNVYTADKMDLQFSRFRQHNLDVMSFDFSKMNNKEGIEVSGILGISVLAAFNLVIDYRDGLVDFQYKPSP